MALSLWHLHQSLLRLFALAPRSRPTWLVRWVGLSRSTYRRTIPSFAICYDTALGPWHLCQTLSDYYIVFRKRHFPQGQPGSRLEVNTPWVKRPPLHSTLLASTSVELSPSAQSRSEPRRDPLLSDSPVSANNRPGLVTRPPGPIAHPFRPLP